MGRKGKKHLKKHRRGIITSKWETQNRGGENGWSKKPNNLLHPVFFLTSILYFFLHFVFVMYGAVEEGV